MQEMAEERDDLSDLENDILNDFDQSEIKGAAGYDEPSKIENDVTMQSFRETSIYADLLK